MKSSSNACMLKQMWHSCLKRSAHMRATSTWTCTEARAREAIAIDARMLQVGQGNLECSLMRRFVAIGLSPSSSSVLYEHAPGVVCNCTRLQQGRALLLDDAKASGFGALVATLASPSDVRRTGAAAAIKNVVVAAHQDGSLGKVVQDRERLRAMLVRCSCPLKRAVMHCLCMLQRQTRAISSCAQECCKADFVTHSQRWTSRGAGLAMYPVYVPIMTDWFQRHAWDWRTLATVLCAHKMCLYLHAGTYKWAATQRACGLSA